MFSRSTFDSYALWENGKRSVTISAYCIFLLLEQLQLEVLFVQFRITIKNVNSSIPIENSTFFRIVLSFESMDIVVGFSLIEMQLIHSQDKYNLQLKNYSAVNCYTCYLVMCDGNKRWSVRFFFFYILSDDRRMSYANFSKLNNIIMCVKYCS